MRIVLGFVVSGGGGLGGDGGEEDIVHPEGGRDGQRDDDGGDRARDEGGEYRQGGLVGQDAQHQEHGDTGDGHDLCRVDLAHEEDKHRRDHGEGQNGRAGLRKSE